MPEEKLQCIENAVQESQSEEQLQSSPLVPTSQALTSSRPKKKPTVTPRTFTRFFTPRSSLGKRRKITSSRQALQDITSPAINRNATSARRKSLTFEPFPDVVPLGYESGWSAKAASTKRRRILLSPDSTVDGSSPIRKSYETSSTLLGVEQLDSIAREASPESDASNGEAKTDRHEDVAKSRIRRQVWSRASTCMLARSLGNLEDLRSARKSDHCACQSSLLVS